MGEVVYLFADALSFSLLDQFKDLFYLRNGNKHTLRAKWEYLTPGTKQFRRIAVSEVAAILDGDYRLEPGFDLNIRAPRNSHNVLMEVHIEIVVRANYSDSALGLELNFNPTHHVLSTAVNKVWLEEFT